VRELYGKGGAKAPPVAVTMPPSARSLFVPSFDGLTPAIVAIVNSQRVSVVPTWRHRTDSRVLFTPPKLNRGEPVLTILLIVVLILMLGGGGYYGYSSYGGRGLGSVLGLVLVIVLVVWLVGGLPIHS
jgi:hypothetical protein